MKIKIAFVISLFLFEAFSLQCQYTYFNNRYNNDYLSSGKSIIETNSGYVIGGVSQVITGDYLFMRIVMTEIDHQGNQLWWKTYGEYFHNYWAGDFRSMVKTHDGGYALGGSIEDSIRVTGMLMKFNEFGDSVWIKIYGDTVSPDYGGIIIRVVQELPDHGFILAGSTYVSEDDGDIQVIRTDSLGNMVWSHTYGQLHRVEEASSVAQLPDKGFLFGYAKVNLNLNYSQDPGILKVDSLGNQIWMKTYGSYKDDWGNAVTVSQDGNYLLNTTFAMEEPGPGNPMMKARIVKTDTAGNILWERKYSHLLFMGASSTIDELSDGNIMATGSGAFEDCMCFMAYLLKTKPNGDSIWMRRYVYNAVPNIDNDFLYDFKITSDHGMIFTGETTGPVEHLPFIWVQKLDSIGCDTVGCDPTVEINEQSPYFSNYEKVTIYPNPASNWVHILFRNDRPDWFSDRKIEIINMFGDLVLEHLVSHLSDNYSLNVTNLPQGIYLLVVQERLKGVYTGKLLISR